MAIWRWKQESYSQLMLELIAEQREVISMNLAGGDFWLAIMSEDTTEASYWLNWRFLVCALFVVTAIASAAMVIWKFEGSAKRKSGKKEITEKEKPGIVYIDEAWKTCKGIHPAILLAFRLFALGVLLTLLIVNVVTEGGGIYYFYTQWTFALVTFYFGIGSAFSFYGCFLYNNRNGTVGATGENVDVEEGTYEAPLVDDEAKSNFPERLNSCSKTTAPQTAGFFGYTFQIVFQMSAGAVTLTDSVFWLILYPFLTSKDYHLNFIDVCLHSINAVFLLGDVVINSMRFPLFRFAYFILWTGTFVIFQWIVHACVSLWWPYPFLDLSSPFAPAWYFAVGLMHVPSYSVFALIIKIKQILLSR